MKKAGQTAKLTDAMECVSPSRKLRRCLRDKRIASFGGVCYVGATIAAEGWLSGLKRRFAKPLYGIKAYTEGSNPSPSAIFFGEIGRCSAGSVVGRPGLSATEAN
jgi:hypothetical protein